MEIWHWWVVAGIAFWVLEIYTPGFVAGNVGLGCFAAALASGLGLSLTWQIVFFSVMILVGFVLVRPFFLKYLDRSDEVDKMGVEGYRGRAGRVLEAIDPKAGTGRVQVGGETWKAASVNSEPIAQDATVVVESMKGLTLFVRQE